MRHVPALALLLFALTGCSEAPPTPVDAPPVKPAAKAPVMEPPGDQSEPVLEPDPAAPPAAAPVGDVKIETLDWDQTQAIVAEYPGKVVVLDLWSTSCPPCLRELPGLVALQDKYPDAVVCVSVCLDYYGDLNLPPSQLEPDVRQVLNTVKAHKVRNVMLSTESDEVFKTTEYPSIPIAYIFDQTGKRAVTFPDLQDPVEFNYADDITPAVEKLLAAPTKL